MIRRFGTSCVYKLIGRYLLSYGRTPHRMSELIAPRCRSGHELRISRSRFGPTHPDRILAYAAMEWARTAARDLPRSCPCDDCSPNCDYCERLTSLAPCLSCAYWLCINCARWSMPDRNTTMLICYRCRCSVDTLFRRAVASDVFSHVPEVHLLRGTIADAAICTRAERRRVVVLYLSQL